jgi:hypothetical protein
MSCKWALAFSRLLRGWRQHVPHKYWCLSIELYDAILDLQGQVLFRSPVHVGSEVSRGSSQWSYCEARSSVLRTGTSAHLRSDGGDWSASRIYRLIPGMGLTSDSRTSLEAVEKRQFLSVSGTESRFHGISVRVFITKYTKSVLQTSTNWQTVTVLTLLPGWSGGGGGGGGGVGGGGFIGMSRNP